MKFREKLYMWEKEKREIQLANPFKHWVCFFLPVKIADKRETAFFRGRMFSYVGELKKGESQIMKIMKKPAPKTMIGLVAAIAVAGILSNVATPAAVRTYIKLKAKVQG